MHYKDEILRAMDNLKNDLNVLYRLVENPQNDMKRHDVMDRLTHIMRFANFIESRIKLN